MSGLLALALALDAALGEPRWLWNRAPHPAVVMGRAVGALDQRLNHPPTQRRAGVLAVAILVIGAGALGMVLAALPLGWVFEIIGAAILLAHRSLIEHVRAVADGLRTGLAEGRSAVAMIVGRDVTAMDAPAVTRAAIESAAENFSDGVMAPAFWFFVGGLPGILIYKIVNTADSMIGYRTERYRDFGWAAARLDDVMNWVPARLTALAIMVVSGRALDRAAWGRVMAEARLHRSPNAGWPEAAIAPVLDVALAGPRSYDGRMEDFPFVHPAGRRDIGPSDIDAACNVLWRVWAGLFGAVAIGALMM